ncbi:TMV resistance protein N-like protein [Corchorus olitorius]|uniref:TMV resistance protein N-like protein n=1 Tax=Corchorus olitorius TaxID=93759 RepID=A0A1R3L264_9ROSI|nr:TMV resistance protein N-like protein [Corchorus olitorius]
MSVHVGRVIKVDDTTKVEGFRPLVGLAFSSASSFTGKRSMSSSVRKAPLPYTLTCRVPIIRKVPGAR